MNKQEIIEQLAKSYKYNKDDSQANQRIIKEWMWTAEGVEHYKEFVENMIANKLDCDEVEEALSKCTIADWLEDMLTPEAAVIPEAKFVIDRIYETHAEIWDMVLNELADEHDKIREALDNPDGDYYLDLQMGSLYVMSNEDYSVVEAYDLYAIENELEKLEKEWVDINYSDVTDVVR